MKKREGFKHLRDRDRDRIQALRESGHTQKEIAHVLGVSESAISRELKRSPTRVGRYVADRAQADAAEKRSFSKRPGMKIEAHPELRQYIIRQLKHLRSPDEIAGRMKAVGLTPRVGTAAIYKWLYSADGKPFCRYLCTQRTRTRRQDRLSKRSLIPDRISLRDRPAGPSLVHAEGDLFVSPTKSGSTACGLLVVAQETKLFTGSLLPSKKHHIVVPAMQRVTHLLSPDTYTFDNGIENVPHHQFGAPAYFCDKGSPWQKPHVESGIGLIRRWFLPKGTNLSAIPDATFQSQLHLLNGKWRKSLVYRSAYEAGLAAGIIDRVPRISLARAVAFR